jgi:hypothetical protein
LIWDFLGRLIELGFFSIFLLFWPVFAAIAGFILALLFFIGVCLLVIGATGMGMNKLYYRQTAIKSVATERLHNVSSVFLGIVIMLFPIGFTLYGIISLFTAK